MRITITSGLLTFIASSISVSAFAQTGAKELDNGRQSSRNLEEVIVSAQRREERLQDVPISISVLNGEKLDSSSVQGVSEALRQVPSVSIRTGGGQVGGTVVTLRGVSTSSSAFSGSSPVAFYVDGVPMGLSRSAMLPDTSAYDLSRVEVLRGPQGTLYGASSIGGVVRVVTEDARTDRLELKARTSASVTEGAEDGGYRADAALNVPFSDQFAARLALGYQDLGGWVDLPNARLKDVNDVEVFNARVKFHAQLTENFDANMSVWRSSSDTGSSNDSRKDETNPEPIAEPQESDFTVYGLQLGYDFDSISLTSMTSHIDLSQSAYGDTGALFGTPPVRVRLYSELASEVFAQEFGLNSTGEGNWRWSLGAMYRKAEDDNYQFRINRVAPIDWTDTSESVAAFGEVTRLFMDGRFELTAGLRYFEDQVTVQENQKQDGSSNPLIRRESEFDALTPRVVLTAHPSEASTAYLSYSEGFRSGFDQNPLVTTAAPDFGPVEPDTVQNYELGYRGTLLDNRLSFDSSVYYLEWQDIQQVILIDYLGALIGPVVNAGGASGFGAELALTARPGDGLEIGANVSWNDLTFDQDVFVTSQGSTRLLFSKGERTTNSPEHTYGVFVNYSLPIRGGFEGRASVSGNYVTELIQRSIVPATIRREYSDTILETHASFSVHSPGNWTFAIFGDNLNNEDGATTAVVSSTGLAQRMRPRTFGLQLEYEF